MNKVIEFINENLVWFIVIIAVVTAVLLFFLIRAIVLLKKGKANPQVSKPEGMTTPPAPEKKKKEKEKKEKEKKTDNDEEKTPRPTLTMVDDADSFTTEYGDGTIIDGNESVSTKNETPARPFVKPEPEPEQQPAQPEQQKIDSVPAEKPNVAVKKFKLVKLTSGEARFKFEENDTPLFTSNKYPDIDIAKSELTNFKQLIPAIEVSTTSTTDGFKYQFDFEGTPFVTSVKGFVTEQEAMKEGLRVKGLL